MDRRSIDERTAGDVVLERLRQLEGGATLLRLARELPAQRAALVGGAVRDILLDRVPRELDVVVTDAHACAVRYGQLLGQPAQISEHERFGTALLVSDRLRVDFASRRTESYPKPGALPHTRQGSIDQDLRRRDFTINAIAVELGELGTGRLHFAEHAISDLNSRRLRVLHQASFIDDPTRLLRLARYSARLGFTVESQTAELARHAVEDHLLSTISGARIGSELRLALSEVDPIAGLREMGRLDVLREIHPRVRVQEDLMRRALALLEEDEHRPVLVLAALIVPLTVRSSPDRAEEARALLDRLEFPAASRDRAIRAALAPAELSDRLSSPLRASELHVLLGGLPAEAVALAGALAGAQGERNAALWLSEFRHIKLSISGDDLLAAGVPAGPEIGRRLSAVMSLRLDGAIAGGADAELAAALDS